MRNLAVKKIGSVRNMLARKLVVCLTWPSPGILELWEMTDALSNATVPRGEGLRFFDKRFNNSPLVRVEEGVLLAAAEGEMTLHTWLLLFLGNRARGTARTIPEAVYLGGTTCLRRDRSNPWISFLRAGSTTRMDRIESAPIPCLPIMKVW